MFIVWLPVESREGVKTERDTRRQTETETGSVMLTAQEIDTGIMPATEPEMTTCKRERKDRLEDRDSNSLRAPYTCSERLLTLQTQ